MKEEKKNINLYPPSLSRIKEIKKIKSLTSTSLPFNNNK
jgi:hypothetical protein